MKYKLINSVTKIETLCDKVTIDGFDYYMSDEEIKDVRPHKGKWQVEKGYILNQFPTYLTDLSECRLVIATNNLNIDIPKVVDEFENAESKIRQQAFYDLSGYSRAILSNSYSISPLDGYKKGYYRSQETHPNSDEDMIGFYRWLNKNSWQDYNDIKQGLFVNTYGVQKQEKELLQLWKEQRPKTVYYE